MKFLLSAFFLLVALSSCEKAFMGCDITVETLVQPTQEESPQRVDRMLGYLFYADTLLYTVSGFEDAQNGYMTHKLSSEKIKYEETAMYNNTTNRLEFKNATQPQCVILVVDPLSQTFAYKGQQVVEDLSILQLSVTFKLWEIEASKRYYENKWYFGK